MKCPLLNKTIEADKGLWVNDPGECLKEECAWWDDGLGQCVIFTIGETFYNLRNDIKVIREKMPHLEQFKRA